MEDHDPVVHNQSGGATLNSGEETNVGGDVVGRDKIISIQVERMFLGDEKKPPPDLSSDEELASPGAPKIPVSIVVAALTASAIILAAPITAIVGPIVVERINGSPLPPSPTPSCISADDIIVTFHIFRGKSEIATLSSAETVSIEPDLTVYLQAEMTPVTERTLPPLDCTWTNTGIATEGKLLHKAGCKIDYRSGQQVIADAVSMQLSQPSCPALAPYPFFILPKP